MPTVTYPYGTSETFVVDKVLGASYQTVKFVAANMHIIKHVSDNSQTIFDVHEHLNEIVKVAGSIQHLVEISKKLIQLMEIHGKLPELMDLWAHLNEFMELHTHLQKFLHLYAERDKWYTLYNEKDKFIALYNNLTKFQVLYDHIAEIISLESIKTELVALYGKLPELQAIFDDLSKLNALYDKLPKLEDLHGKIAVMDTLFANMSKLVEVHAKLPIISTVHSKLPVLEVINSNQTKLDSIYNNLTALNAIYQHEGALLDIHANLPDLLDLLNLVFDPNWTPVLPSNSINVNNNKVVSLRVDPNPNNIIQVGLNGVLVDGSSISSGGVNFTPVNPLELDGSDNLKLKLATGNNLLSVQASGIKGEVITENSNSVTLAGNGSTGSKLKGEVKLDPAADNMLSVGSAGITAKAGTVANKIPVAAPIHKINNNTVLALNLSSDSWNLNTITSNSLLTRLYYSDTTSIDLTGKGTQADPLKGIVKTHSTGALKTDSNGLYLDLSVDPAGTVEFTGNGSSTSKLKGNVKLAPNNGAATNALQAVGGALYVNTYIAHSPYLHLTGGSATDRFGVPTAANRAETTAELGVALGAQSTVTHSKGVAIGHASQSFEANGISVGSPSIKRKISNVAPATEPHQAVTKAQLDSATGSIDTSALVKKAGDTMTGALTWEIDTFVSGSVNFNKSTAYKIRDQGSNHSYIVTTNSAYTQRSLEWLKASDLSQPINSSNTDFLASLSTSGVFSARVLTALGNVVLSSKKIKKDIKDMPFSFSTIEALRPVSFKYSLDYATDKEQLGFIAEEVEEILPNLVDECDQMGVSNVKSLNMVQLIPLLVKAVQELKSELDVLKGERSNVR